MISEDTDPLVFLNMQIQSMFLRGTMTVWALWKGYGFLPENYDPLIDASWR